MSYIHSSLTYSPACRHFPQPNLKKLQKQTPTISFPFRYHTKVGIPPLTLQPPEHPLAVKFRLKRIQDVIQSATVTTRAPSSLLGTDLDHCYLLSSANAVSRPCSSSPDALSSLASSSLWCPLTDGGVCGVSSSDSASVCLTRVSTFSTASSACSWSWDGSGSAASPSISFAASIASSALAIFSTRRATS